MDSTPDFSQSFWMRELWIMEIVIGILLFILANYGLKKGIKYLRRRLHFISHDWKDRLDQIIYLPLHFFLWVVAIIFVLDVIAHRFSLTAAQEFTTPVRAVALIICLTWIILRWKNEIQQVFIAKRQHRKGMDPGLVHALNRLSTIVILVIAALIILQVLGLNIMPLVAFGGIGAAAIGFAAKDVIANFFGGFMLYLNRPFMVGDFIILNDKKIEGHVEEIGWYLTAIRDKEKRPVYLPNSIFASQLVINASRMSHRRIREKVSVSYGDFSKLKQLIQDIHLFLKQHASIDINLPLLTFFEGYREFSLDIVIDAYCLETREDEFLKVKQDILFQIGSMIETHKATMPFPTMTILTEKEMAR